MVKKRQRQYHTTTVERLLLLTAIVLIPLQPSLPAVAGFSTPYLIFATLAGYILLRRPRALARTWAHPAFLAAFVLLMVGALIESIHPLSRYSEIFRIGQMFVGAIFVASLCRDRRALHVSIYGFLIAGVLVSILLFGTTYGALRQATATDFGEASKVRHDAVADAADMVAGLAFTPARGAVVALALSLTAKSAKRSYLFLGIALFCIVGTFLPMSRSGIGVVGVSCATVMFAYGVRHVRVLLIATALAIGALIWVPEAVFARLTLTPETAAGKMESRQRIYQAAIDHLPEYIVTGVGAGNFKGSWGVQTDFYKKKVRSVYGAHNAFIQIAIFWGLAGLLMLIVVVYLAYCCLPRGGGKDVLVLSLYGIAVALLLQLMISHVLAAKEFSLGLGLLVGAHRWIWPKGITLSARRGQGHRTPALEHAS
jgi:hypothetical protein